MKMFHQGRFFVAHNKEAITMTNPKGRFGIHGGQYIPETLMNAVQELEAAYEHYKNDPAFQAELTQQACNIAD